MSGNLVSGGGSGGPTGRAPQAAQPCCHSVASFDPQHGQMSNSQSTSQLSSGHVAIGHRRSVF